MSKYAIIVAGGTGNRMKSEIPKQFLLLKGIPILMHTLRVFKQYDIVLVLPEDQRSYWSQLCNDYDFQIAHQVVSGGHTRFQSVKNGLKNVPDQGLVAIHDGVRPLVREELIKSSFILAQVHGNAIAAIPLKDSIREVVNGANEARYRSNYQLIQTPQTFNIELIKKAYLKEESSLFTDDASVLENDGHRIHLFEGSYSNVKITTPEDLKIAYSLMK